MPNLDLGLSHSVLSLDKIYRLRDLKSLYFLDIDEIYPTMMTQSELSSSESIENPHPANSDNSLEFNLSPV